MTMDVVPRVMVMMMVMVVGPVHNGSGNDRVIKVLTSGPHLAAGTQPPRSFDFDLDVDVDNSSQIVGSKDDFDNICAAQYETHLS